MIKSKLPCNLLGVYFADIKKRFQHASATALKGSTREKMIVEVTKDNIEEAAKIYSVSWRESHRDISGEDYWQEQTPAHVCEKFRLLIQNGANLYMLVEKKALGIVSVDGDLIENLYILPEEQHKGYGTKLLEFAVSQCLGTPRLFILSTGGSVGAFYMRHGFVFTGKTGAITETLYEREMILK